ncbi:MAG: response regulator [Deltaproteobacteria bacterium]|nr:response regulator [Deltaproteobacteria bacterium]MBW1924982.1 response regulator [Deltaproteobacteria bacterium]MBW1950944.1 response regulator [Deltaproteobacteria bacterium]MBW2009190.1 response regulator [Deltaproteobacteria bacterium]MBW2103452.1 response regulator [Deltaproteobacteria bacterium]
MADTDVLKEKRILIVDDEPDILETLEEILDMCLVDKAPDFEAARKFLEKNTYDAVVLDIMGVRGYDLLELANEKGVPALMLTAHALSPENLVRSIKGGARSYIPKDKISDVAEYLADVIRTAERGERDQARWLTKLKPFFDKKFGPNWQDQDRTFWDAFEKKYRPDREELGKML